VGEGPSQDCFEPDSRNLAVGHPDHVKAGGLEHFRASGVVGSLIRTVVRVALQLQHQPLGGAIEVDDEATQDVLAAESQAEYAALT